MDIKIPHKNSENSSQDSNSSNQSNSLGNTFYKERTKREITLEEVAESTCIHIATLRAIEAGDRTKMPAEVFSRGFVKLYAEFLDLDTQDIINLYNNEIVALGVTGQDSNELIGNDTFTNKSPLITLPRVLLLILFFFLIFVGFWLLTDKDSSSRQSRNVYFEKYYVERNPPLYAAKKESSNVDATGSIATSLH